MVPSCQEIDQKSVKHRGIMTSVKVVFGARFYAVKYDVGKRKLGMTGCRGKSCSVVTVSLFSRSISVCRCFREKSVVGLGFGVYTCVPSATVQLARHIVWSRGPSG